MKNKNNTFSKKIVLITGAASGLGRALVNVMSEKGAVVIGADVNPVSYASHMADQIILDVTDEQQWNNALDVIFKKFGRLDYLFNVAGIGITGEVVNHSVHDASKLINVNVTGTTLGTLKAYQRMVKQGHGHIVNFGSIFGLIESPGNTLYGMTKHAITGLTLSIRSEGKDFGIKVTLVAPGLIRTPLTDSYRMIDGIKNPFFDFFPFRLLEPQEAAEKILNGVLNNKALIVFPLYARILNLLNRINPSLVSSMLGSELRKIRKEIQRRKNENKIN